MSPDGRCARCKECSSAYKKRHYATHQDVRDKARERSISWHKANPETKRRKARKSWLRVNYGMSCEEYDLLLARQNGLCGICGKKPKKLVVDHDHATGEVRGLLCSECNLGIGLLGDTLTGLRNAANYLGDRVQAYEPLPFVA